MLIFNARWIIGVDIQCQENWVTQAANASDTEAAFLDLNLYIHNDTVSAKIYDKRDDFDINFPSLNAPLLVYININLFTLPQHLCMLLTSIIVTNS